MPNFTLLETSQPSLDSGPPLAVLNAHFCANQKMPRSRTPQVCQKPPLMAAGPPITEWWDVRAGRGRSIRNSEESYNNICLILTTVL